MPDPRICSPGRSSRPELPDPLAVGAFTCALTGPPPAPPGKLDSRSLMVEIAEIPAREGLLREEALAFFVAFPSQAVSQRFDGAPEPRAKSGPSE